MCSLDLGHGFWLCYIVIGVGAAAGCGLSGTANLGDYGADDPRRSQEPPALAAQRSKQLFITHTKTQKALKQMQSLSYRNRWWCELSYTHSLFFCLSPTPTYTFPHTQHRSLTLWCWSITSVLCVCVVKSRKRWHEDWLNSVFWCSLPSHLIPSHSTIELHQPGPAPAQKDDPDGRGNRRRHVVPECQQICPQRSGCQELHGGRGLHCEDWR